MGERGLRVFHISDLHMRSVDGPQKDRARLEEPFRWRVLGDKWTRHLAEIRADGVPVDLVVFTGDLADWGHPTDYPRALAFLKETCAALDVPLERLFLVPGNHDIDRTIQPAAWKWLRKNIGTKPHDHSLWMAGDAKALRGNPRRDQVLERQRAFWDAVTSQLGRPELDPRRSPHGRLGYRQTIALDGLAHPLHVIGLDTAWLAGDEHDGGALRLTEHQIALLTTDHGAPLPGLRLALMHHRFADLADGTEARKLLADRIDLLLHGHQHEPTADVLQGPDHDLLVLAAGCLYEGDEEHRYPNACQVIDLALDDRGRPRHASVRFRGWSARNYFWGDDALLYQHAPGGHLRLRRGEHGWHFDDPTASTGAANAADAAGARRPRMPERHEMFIGREPELARIDAALRGNVQGRVAIVALQGMAGVGKTYLAQEFYARHPGRFGAYQRVVIDPDHPGTAATWLAVLGKQAGIDAARFDEAAVAEVLRLQRTIVHVDNVDSAAAATLVAELARVLAGVPMLVTGRYTELGTAAGSGWTRVELAPLDPEDALRLLHDELAGAGIAVPEADLRELVRQVAGLPLALHLASGYLRRGVTVARFLEQLRSAGLALDPRDPADHLRQDRVRGVLSTSFAISRDAMLAEAGTDAPTWAAALASLGWAPRAGFGRSLGAALTGLAEAPGAFDGFIEAAVALSLARRLRPEERSSAAWAVHSLLGEFLRGDTGRDDVDARIGAWVAARSDKAPQERAARWDELSAEATSIGEWLGVASGAAVDELLPIAWDFAISRGPIGPWLVSGRRAYRCGTTTDLLWAICKLASAAGELGLVLDVATEMARLAADAGDDRSHALALGQIASVLTERGELDEALRIRREEELPVYERLDDVRSRAVTMGQIADVLAARGELDEALRIRYEETLPVYERLGDSRARAITLSRIADVLAARGELDEALRIRREEALPVFEQLGDSRERAITLSQIADALAARGELDEALRIWRAETLPVYERLGEVRSRAVTLAKIAAVLVQRGELDEALQISCEQALTVFEKLGDIRERAVTLGNIANIRAKRGELDQALRILRDEALPVFERLGDLRARAITLGKIADIIADRGEHDRALTMWREASAIFSKLGDPRLIARARRRLAKLEGQGE